MFAMREEIRYKSKQNFISHFNFNQIFLLFNIFNAIEEA